MGKCPFSFRRTSVRRRLKKTALSPSLTDLQHVGSPTSSPLNDNTNASNNDNNNSLVTTVVGGIMVVGKWKKKTSGARLWMRFHCLRQSKLVECNKSTIIHCASIPTRDLRILGPVFSHSYNVLSAHEFNPMITRNFVNIS